VNSRDLIKDRINSTLNKQKQRLFFGLKELDIWERADIEPFIDEMKRQVWQTHLKQRSWLKLEENYSKHELGLRGVMEVDTYNDKGGDEWQINKAIQKVGAVSGKVSGRKQRKARELLTTFASAGYYAYLVLRKKLGIPCEHPMLRPWYAKFLPFIPSLINPGGTVLLKEGIFNLSDSIILNGNSNIRIEGLGWATEIHYTNGYNAIHIGTDTATENIIISDLRIIDDDDTYVPDNASGVRIEKNGTYVIVQRCRIDQSGSDAIYGSYSYYNFVYDNFIHKAHGPYGAIHPHGQHSWIITNNFIHTTDHGEAVRHGYVIANNYAIDVLKGILSGDYGAVVSGNYIYNVNRVYGIGVWEDKSIVVGNKVYNGGNEYVELQGILVDRNECIVTGNLIQELTTNANGIKVQGSNNLVSNNVIVGNAYYGIVLVSSSYNRIESNILKDNSQALNAGYNEVFISDDGETYSTYNIVKLNTIKCTATNKAEYGIAENSGSDDHNIYEGNYIEGAVTAAMNILGANSLVRSNFGWSTIKTVTADYTMTWGDEMILADASSAAITVTLPDPASYPDEALSIKKIDSSTNAVTVAPHGSETIDGAASVSLANQWDSVTVKSDGTNWYVL